jgi:hypothetical protein
MNRDQAELLLTMIGEQAALKTEVHQVGNGDWSVRVMDKHDWFYLWSREDWEANKHRWRIRIYTLETV